MSLGPTVRLQVGSVDIIVTSRRGQTFDRVVFLLHGIDVTLYDVIALKSGRNAGCNHECVHWSAFEHVSW